MGFGAGLFIVDDPIKDSWSIHVDSTKTISTLRNLIWPGYFAYHKANTDDFGGVYIGYGIKNIDIPFLLPYGDNYYTYILYRSRKQQLKARRMLKRLLKHPMG